MHQMMKNAQNGKKKRNSKNKGRKRHFIHRSQETNGYILFCESNLCPSGCSNQTCGGKQPKKCAVENQTTKVTKTSSSKTSASQNDPIKLKISQSKVYLTKQHKGSNYPIKQYN